MTEFKIQKTVFYKFFPSKLHRLLIISFIQLRILTFSFRICVVLAIGLLFSVSCVGGCCE